MPSKRTIQGQAWDQISLSAYGTEKLMHRITACNVEVADTLIFGGNLELALPVLAHGSSRQSAVQPAPWERMDK